jgi:hypothetical protein
MKLGDSIVRVGTGYTKLLKGLAFWASCVLALAAVAAATVLPIWYFATLWRGAYTAAVLVLCLCALAFSAWRSVAERLSQGGAPRDIASGVARVAFHATLAAGAVAAVVAAAVFTLRGWGLVAVPAALAYLFVSGLAFFRKTRPRSR